MTDEIFQAVIVKLAKGDKNALKLIYEAYVRLIYAVVYDMVGKKEDAEDITSDFFIKLIHVAKSFRAGNSHKAWLVSIARNMTIDYLRKNRREMPEANDEIREGVIETHGAVERSKQAEKNTIISEDMKNAMKQLKPGEREIIDMKLVGQLTFQEIADIQKKPIGTITWTYNQGIKKLRRCLADYEKD